MLEEKDADRQIDRQTEGRKDAASTDFGMYQHQLFAKIVDKKSINKTKMKAIRKTI